MKDGSDGKNLVIVDDAASGLARWLPAAVVFSVVGGFVALSWYAYHAGMQSVKEDDLVVIEADKTPLKEKPADPGGMQFPNQDKTVFDTFSGSTPAPAKVERVLPKPEEPMSKDLDTSDTSTWINEKLQHHAREAEHHGTEKVFGADDKKTAKADKKDKKETPNGSEPDHQVIAAAASDDSQSVTYVAHKSPAKPADVLDDAVKSTKNSAAAAEDEPSAEDVAQAKAEKLKDEKAKAEQDSADQKAKAEKAKEDKAAAEKQAADEKAKKAEAAAEEKATAEKAKAEKAKDEKKPAAKASSGAYAVQLGAYRSEDEARDAWARMHLKQRELSDKEPVILRADLGAKGIYYRLRVADLDSAAEAKSLCGALSSHGQACILPTDK